MADGGDFHHLNERHGRFHSAAKEDVVYLPIVETSTGKNYLATVCVDPVNEHYGKIIHRLYTLHNNDELHHCGWNTCASCYGNPAARRTKLILPSLGSSRIYVIDTSVERAPKIHAVVEPAELKAHRVSRPHTCHYMSNGDVLISTMADERDNNKGAFVVLDGTTWKLKGTWNNQDIKYGYDFSCHQRENALISTGWGKPSSWWKGLDRSRLREDYGSDLHVWDLKKGEYLHPLELGDEGRMPMGIKFLNNPARSEGFVCCAYSSNVFRLFINAFGEWQAEKVIDIPDKKVKGWTMPSMPGLITDVLISMDDRYLYLSNWIQGDLRQYDITDTRNPKLVGRLFLGGSMTSDSKVKTINDLEPQPNPVYVKGRKLYGGPQMMQLSLDGKRLYITDSLITPWDKQFYPEMVKNGCVMLQVDCDTEKGGLSLNENFLTDFGKEPDGPVLAHEIRYPGGDCSSDIYLPPPYYSIQQTECSKYHTQSLSVSTPSSTDVDALLKSILNASQTLLVQEDASTCHLLPPTQESPVAIVYPINKSTDDDNFFFASEEPSNIQVTPTSSSRSRPASQHFTSEPSLNVNVAAATPTKVPPKSIEDNSSTCTDAANPEALSTTEAPAVSESGVTPPEAPIASVKSSVETKLVDPEVTSEATRRRSAESVGEAVVEPETIDVPQPAPWLQPPERSHIAELCAQFKDMETSSLSNSGKPLTSETCANSQPPKPRVRKDVAIAIVDPNTKAIINEDQLSTNIEESSNIQVTPTSSNRSRPAPQHFTSEPSQHVNVTAAPPTKEKLSTDIGAQFRAQVATSLSNSRISATSESTPPSLPSNLPNVLSHSSKCKVQTTQASVDSSASDSLHSDSVDSVHAPPQQQMESSTAAPPTESSNDTSDVTQTGTGVEGDSAAQVTEEESQVEPEAAQPTSTEDSEVKEEAAAEPVVQTDDEKLVQTDDEKLVQSRRSLLSDDGLTPPATSPATPPNPTTKTVLIENKENTPAVTTPSPQRGSKPVTPDSSKQPLVKDVPGDHKLITYSREFLISLQKVELSLAKPDGLGNNILQEIMSSGRSMPSVSSHRRDINPDYFKPANCPRDSSSKPAIVSHDSTMMGEVLYQREEVKLRKVENAWKPRDKALETLSEEEKAHTKLLKKFRGMLNKITPSTFKPLVEKILQLPVRTEKDLSGVIHILYENVLHEPLYCKVYATVAQSMAKEYKVKRDGSGEEIKFLKLLLARCQTEFEMLLQDDTLMLEKMKNLEKALEKAQTTEEKNRLNEEFKTFQTKARHRKLGCMRFFGELFLLHMLTVNIMLECVIYLLKAADEESLKYVCRLWATIGKVLDTNDKARGYNDLYFAQMKKIATGQARNVSVRIRFLLQDVIELRQNNWVPRRDKSTPKTLEEIHQQMAIEAHEKQVMIEWGLPSRPSGGRVIQPPRGNRRDEQDGWSRVKTGTQRVDPTKLRLTSQKVGGEKELQLGPAKSFGGWGKGSSGSGKSIPPQQEERQSAPGNRFSAMSGAGADSHVRDERSRSSNRLPMGRGSMSRGRGGSNRMGTPRGSMEKEKSSAVEMARQLSKGSRGSSRENSVDGRNMRTPTPTRGQVNRPSAQSTAPVVKQLSIKDWETKSRSITDEYLHNNDIQEVLDIFRDELASQADKELFTELCINHTLERSQQARRGTGNMLAELIKHKLLPLDAHLKGLSAVLEFAEDLAIDIPNVWKYLGELVAPMFTTAALPLSQLETVCGPLLAIDKAALLAVAILSEASQKVGHVELGKRWADSKLTWSKFLPAGVDEQSFIASNKLEYTVTSPDASQPTTSLSPSDISAQLDKLLITDRAPNEAIFDWINSKLSSDIRGEPAFIRSLTTSVVKSCIKRLAMQETEFKDRVPLLLKYYDSKAERELAALSAFEDLMTSLEHPAGLFSDFCYALNELDLIADESFYHWESNSKNGIAVKSVGKFLKWLKYA